MTRREWFRLCLAAPLAVVGVRLLPDGLPPVALRAHLAMKPEMAYGYDVLTQAVQAHAAAISAAFKHEMARLLKGEIPASLKSIVKSGQ